MSHTSHKLKRSQLAQLGTVWYQERNRKELRKNNMIGVILPFGSTLNHYLKVEKYCAVALTVKMLPPHSSTFLDCPHDNMPKTHQLSAVENYYFSLKLDYNKCYFKAVMAKCLQVLRSLKVIYCILQSSWRPQVKEKVR